MIARAFYDDVAIVVLDYILHEGVVEEHKMAEHMNLPFKRIRQALLELKEHQILTFREGKRDKRHDEKSGNMFTRGPDMGKMVYWTFDSDIKSVVKYRFIELRKQLDKLVEDARSTHYICSRCRRRYTVEEALPNFTCHTCTNRRLDPIQDDLNHARIQRDKGLEQIATIEKQLKECEHISLPPSFFGIFHDKNTEQEKELAKKKKIHTTNRPENINTRGIVVEINLQEVGVHQDKPLENADQELVKFYTFLEKPRKKRKLNEGEQNGKRHDIKIDTETQKNMNENEFKELYNNYVAKRIYL